MTDKKKHKHVEEVKENQPAEAESPEVAEQVSDESEALKRQLDEAEAKASE